jgi:hypothetical protein
MLFSTVTTVTRPVLTVIKGNEPLLTGCNAKERSVTSTYVQDCANAQ